VKSHLKSLSRQKRTQTKEVNPVFSEYVTDWRHRFYFLVGGYGSSKSYHTALKIILKCLQEKRNVLVIRDVMETMRDSVYSLFLEIIEDMNLNSYINYTKTPMELTFSNGSKVLFKGMDKPEKLKSIHGISIIWIEEASEIKYDGFKELLGRARHPTDSIHFILTTNPVDLENWVYKHFFIDDENEIITLDDKILYEEKEIILNDTYYHHSTVDDNYFLPESYAKSLDEMEEYDPDLYRVARLGRFGANGKKVLPQFMVVEQSAVNAIVSRIPEKDRRIGMDFGFVDSYNAIVWCAIDRENKILFIYHEYYDRGKTDDVTLEEIRPLIKDGQLIRADSAEPKTIAFYNRSGLRMVGAKKGQNSRLANTKKVKRFKKIICGSDCKNTERELKNLAYKKDRNGKLMYDQFNIDPHTLSAIWYGLDGYEVEDLKMRKNYSGKGARR